MPRRNVLAAAALLAAAASTGCYTYRAAPPEAIPAGARVRLDVSPAGSAALAPTVGNAVTGLEGELTAVAGDTMVVRVQRLHTAGGVPLDWSGAPVGVPRGAVTGLRRQAFSARRSALLAGLSVALGVIAIAAIQRAGGSASSGDGPPSGSF